MSMKKWESIARRRVSKEQLEELRAEAAAELAVEMNLPELRKALGKTQAEVASAAKMAQAKVSEFERRSDHTVSALRRVIEGMGGVLEVVAVFPKGRVRLKGV